GDVRLRAGAPADDHADSARQHDLGPAGPPGLRPGQCDQYPPDAHRRGVRCRFSRRRCVRLREPSPSAGAAGHRPLAGSLTPVKPAIRSRTTPALAATRRLAVARWWILPVLTVLLVSPLSVLGQEADDQPAAPQLSVAAEPTEAESAATPGGTSLLA